MSYTKGPWYLLQTDGADFTAISTKDKLPLSKWHKNKDGSPKEDSLDTANEVLGSSEWLRATEDDLVLMAKAPELYEALKELVKCNDAAGSDPAVSQWFGSPVYKQCHALLAKLKEIE